MHHEEGSHRTIAWAALGRRLSALACVAAVIGMATGATGAASDVVTDVAVWRGALTATIRRTLDAPGTFDGNGWLRIGFAGHQPAVGETYISTGSLYLCAVALLPLGLPAHDEFWSAPPQPWTSARAWSGAAFPIDRALPRD